MKNFVDKVKGEAAVVGGVIEKTVGKVIGNEKLVAAGEALEEKGKAEKGKTPPIVEEAKKDVSKEVKKL
jgi:uncharacterized protein YjbJ (UPF0337 family)